MKRPYECQYPDCDKKFTTRFSLRRHLAAHQPQKQFICLICHKKFALGQYLKEHTYIHTGQKPFKCTYEGCTRAFRQAGKLSMHKKLHQNKIFLVQKVKKRQLLGKKELKFSIVIDGSVTSQEKEQHSSQEGNDRSTQEYNSQQSREESENNVKPSFMEEMKHFSRKALHDNFTQLSNHMDTSEPQPNVQLMKQITGSLQMPKMVKQRRLPLPETLFQNCSVPNLFGGNQISLQNFKPSSSAKDEFEGVANFLFPAQQAL